MKTIQHALTLLALSLTLTSAPSVLGQAFTFSTIAGAPGHGTADGTGTSAQFYFPGGCVTDGSGNLYVSDTYNHCIRKVVITTGETTTFAGTAGTSGSADGTGLAAQFNYPVGIARDASGNLYVADSGNFVIRKITPAAEVTTFSGQVGVRGFTSGAAVNVKYSNVQGLALSTARNELYVADTGNHIIRAINLTSGFVVTTAGSAGSVGNLDGEESNAQFSSPTSLTIDQFGNLWVTDYGNNAIRQVTTSGTVTTRVGFTSQAGFVDGIAGTARLNHPTGICRASDGFFYVTESGNNRIRKVSNTGAVTTLPVELAAPRSICADTAGNLFVTDTGLHAIRKVTTAGVASFIAGRFPSGATNDIGTAASFNSPEGMAVDPSGNVFIADTANHTIRKVTADGTVTTFAGTAGAAGSSDGINSLFRSPSGACSDPLGNIFVADTGNHTIRKITPDGVVTTFAGTAGLKATTNGTGTAARFNEPRDLIMDTAGNLFVTDSKNHMIRKITPAGVVTTLAGGAAITGSNDSTVGTLARFNTPSGIGIDSAGNLYIADRGNATIRKVTSTGVVTTFAGTANNRNSTDGTGNAARFYDPVGIAVDTDSNVFVSDLYYNNLRKITTGRVVTTVAGQPWLTDQASTLSFFPYGGDVNGSDSVATFYHPTDIAFSGADLFVLDRGNHLLRKGTAAVDPLAPVITAQPASQTVVEGTAASFTVVTSAMAPTFQWKKNGNNISGATSATYNIATTASADEANYSVVVTEGGKSTTSLAAILRLYKVPVIVTQPLAVTVNQGQTATLSVKATGLFLSYDWKKGGVSLGAPNLPTLTIANAQATDDANYSVDVTNTAGTTPSNSIHLTVRVPPGIPVGGHPAHQIVALNTASVTFTVAHTGTNLAYQWYKGTAPISGTTNPTALTDTLTITNIKSTDATYYRCVIRSLVGLPSVTSNSANLVVVDQTTVTTQDVVAGLNAALTARAYGTITGYQWKYNGTPISAPGAPVHYSGYTGKTLSIIKAVDPSTSATHDEGAYTCVISSTAGNLETSAINLRVLIKPVVDPIVLPASTIMVSEFFTWQATAVNDPAKFIISGYPSGLTYNATTGVLSGRPLVKGAFTVKVFASNAAGTSVLPQSASLTVSELTPAAVGTYQGPITRSNNVLLGDDLGGRITLTVPTTGVCTGGIYLGKSYYPFTGPLNTTASGGPQTSTIYIDNKAPISDYRIIFTITPGTRSLSGTVEDGTYLTGTFTPGGSTSLQAWLPVVDTVKRTALGGNYTMAMTHAVAGDDKPQGYSYGAFKVGPTGLASGSLKMADASVITFANIPVGDAGSFQIFTLLYGNTGSVHGSINIDTTDNNKLNASALGWTKKFQTAANRYFKSGFGPLDLTTFGRRYTIPTTGTLAMGLTAGPGNAKLVFTDDPAPSLASRLDISALEIKAGSPSPVVLPTTVTATATNGSHAKMTLSVVPGSGTTFTAGSTGLVSGLTTLVDQNPMVVATSLVPRSNYFYGMIVDDGSGPPHKAYGFVLIQELPSASFTALTSPYHSAKVVLSAP
ncbi:MAG: hypothetical protein JNM99_02830 [Verrucomicrobiaceae bacterium]|nr:hypothetical protein [Verrucomicrobiaceae bacterium]